VTILIQSSFDPPPSYKKVSCCPGSHDAFHWSYTHVRDARANIAFGEQILDIADNTADDSNYNPDSTTLAVQKEAIHRSRR
jgi:hypothetical protein